MSHAAIADLIVPIAKRRGYHAERVTWDDCTRSVVSDGFSFSPLEGLTSSGPCITDSRTVDDEKKPIWMVRSENFNERIGYVKASEVAVVVGNEEATATKNLHSVTLADYLRNFGIYAKHAGAPDSGSLLADALDNTISIRPQVAFVRTGTRAASLSMLSPASMPCWRSAFSFSNVVSTTPLILFSRSRI
jgi:hypothetical protein